MLNSESLELKLENEVRIRLIKADKRKSEARISQ